MNGQYSFLTLVSVREDKPMPRHALVEKVHFTFDDWVARVKQAGEYVWLKEFTIESQRIIYLDHCWDDEAKWKEWCNAVQETNKE